MPAFFDEIKTYVGFGDADAAALRRFLPYAAPHFERICDHFYERILEDRGARTVLTEGESTVGRLKVTLAEWLQSGLEGPHDQAYYIRRSRIGRVHVRIGMPQQYMLTAMNVMRLSLRAIVDEVWQDDLEERRAIGNAVEKLLDLELAIMLRTYQEDSEERLRRNTRLAAVGQLAASIAHELRNPLGVMESSLYLLRRRAGTDPQLGKHLDRIGNQIRTSSGIITDLLEMTRDRPPMRTPTPLGKLVDDALDVARLPPTIAVHRSEDAGLPMLVEPGLVVRAIVNLLQNAAAAMDGGQGNLRIASRREGDQAWLSVADDGPGFTEDMLASAFEPLVTGRPHGVGLGLALVKRICERHGGAAVAANAPEGGAVVSLRLPVHLPGETTA
jgi:signal transduction histidine kinase